MKKLRLALILVAFSASTHAQTQAPSQSMPDASEKTQCWDTLQNLARDQRQNEGKLGSTGTYATQHAGSSEDRKLQGPGAEPKDPTGVTVGESNQARQQTGASVRPPGLPNC